MYGQTIDFDLTLYRTAYAPITLPAHVTETPHGIEFRFEFEENPWISGSLLVRTDAGTLVEVQLGGDEPGDVLEVGDWGLRDRIAAHHVRPLCDDVDEQTCDTLRSLIYTAMAYAQVQTGRITARLDPARPAIETTTARRTLMDPAATWQRLLRYADSYAEGCTTCPDENCPHDTDLTEISELIHALGSWRARGGYDSRS